MGNEVKPPSPMTLRGLFRDTILDVTWKFQNVLVRFYGNHFRANPNIIYCVRAPSAAGRR